MLRNHQIKYVADSFCYEEKKNRALNVNRAINNIQQQSKFVTTVAVLKILENE